MRLSLHEVLAIVGRLDDTPGFDTPRERFRRFLIEHMTSGPVARTFVDEAQQLISEQYQRALQDAVLATGRLLGFETTFGEYERHGSAAREAGQWLSRRRLAVTVQLWSDDASMDSGAVVRALHPRLFETDLPHARLCVLSPSCGSRPRIEEAIGMDSQSTRVVSLRSLMDLVSLANTSHVTHDDVLRLLKPPPALEGSIGLLARLVHPGRARVPAPTREVEAAARLPACWVYVVREHEPGSLDPAGVSDRLSMTVAAGEMPAIVAEDVVAFLVPSRGVVAQAEVASVAQEETADASDFQVTFTLGLRNIVILSPPVLVGTEQRLNLELQAAVSQEPCVRVARQEFDALILAKASVD